MARASHGESLLEDKAEREEKEAKEVVREGGDRERKRENDS